MFQKQYENLSPQKITERIPVEWPNEKLCVRPMVFFLQSLAVIGFLTSLPLWGNDIDKVGSKTKGGGHLHVSWDGFPNPKRKATSSLNHGPWP